MLQEKIAELQARLDEANFWRKLKQEKWPFSVDTKTVPDAIRTSILEAVYELCDTKIEELESEEDAPKKPKKPSGPSDEEREVLEAANKILQKYKGGSNQQPLPSRPTHKKHKQGEAVLVEHGAVRKGQKATLVDIANIRSVNKEHATEFVPDEQVKVAKVYTDKQTGLELADIVKTSPAGTFRATVPVEDLEA